MSRPLFAAFFSRRILICLFTGFSSGLPFYLLSQLLSVWLKQEGLSLTLIAAFALVRFPYVCKFLWAPLVDRYALPWLGHHRGWMAFLHLALFFSISSLGLLSPQHNLALTFALAALLAFFSASLDIVLDAFRRNLLPDAQLELGNSIHVNAYKIASLVPASLALALSSFLPWALVFLVVALFMLPGLAMTLLVSEPPTSTLSPKTLREAVFKPFREFIFRHGPKPALLVFAFLLLYKLGDSLCVELSQVLYLDMGYGPEHIALVAKHANLWPSLVGGLIGGLVMVKIGLNRALWLFGSLQALSILGFASLAHLGPAPVDASRLWTLASVSGFEALAAGLGTAAIVSFIARTTHPAYVATQFALLSGLPAIGRTFINANAGWLAEKLGWTGFFFLCFSLALPGMLLLLKVAPWSGKPPRLLQNGNTP